MSEEYKCKVCGIPCDWTCICESCLWEDAKKLQKEIHEESARLRVGVAALEAYANELEMKRRLAHVRLN